MGTAPKGFTSEPYLMSDLAAVVREFGATSELARAASEVKKGGATNIFLYRLPGTAPEVAHVGADHADATAGGITIRTIQASPEAAAKYGVAYRHAKNYRASGSGAANRFAVTGDLQIVNLETNQVVWQGSALEGATIDNGELDVDFDLGDVDLGIVDATPGAESITVTFSGTGTGSTTIRIAGVDVTFAASATPATMATNFHTALIATSLAGATASASKPFVSAAPAAAAVTISATGTVNADGDLVFGTGDLAGFTARLVVEKVTKPAGSTVVVALGDNHAQSSDIGIYPQDPSLPFAVAGGGTYVPLDIILAGGTAAAFGLGGPTTYDWAGLTATSLAHGGTTLAEFSAGDAGDSISLMKRFEKLHTAFEDLDLAPFDIVVPYGISLDSKNTATSAVVFTEDVYPTPKTAIDALGYCEIRNNGDYTYSYFWSDDAENLKIASADTAASYSGESFTFSEVNFAHLLAKYCYENSSDYRSVHGVIGTTIPASLSARGIRAYFGSAPTYNYNRETNSYFIVSAEDDGAGLLGDKFVGGRSTFNGGLKHGGFFLTSDGTMDYAIGNLLTDDGGKKVDLGKYLSVVAIFGRVVDDINPRNPAYVTNAAGIYAGMLPQVAPADSLINATLPGLLIDYRLETKTVDAAAGLGLVVAKNEVGVAIIADSPTFASPTSDYTRLTTVRIVNKIAEELRGAARPYIGKGLSAPRRAALESALGEVIKANIAGEPTQTITNGSFKIEQSAQDRVLGKMKVYVTLTPVFELRQVTFNVNLSAS
jgi:hypothetical protein